MSTIFFLVSSVPPGNGESDLVNSRHITAIVDWQDKSPLEKNKDAMKKLDMILNGSDFHEPFSPEFVGLDIFKTNIIGTTTAITNRAENKPGSAKALKAAVKLILGNVNNLRTMLQLKMDTCVPDEAIRMCLAAGYAYKSTNVRGKRKNAVKQTTEAGVVDVDGEKRGGRMWQMSFNPYANPAVITDLQSTSGGVKKGVDTGKSKVEVFFRWRLVLTKGRYGEWSPWYSGLTP